MSQQRERSGEPQQAKGTPERPPLPVSAPFFLPAPPGRGARGVLHSPGSGPRLPGAPAPRGAAPGGVGGGAGGTAALSLRWGEGAGAAKLRPQWQWGARRPMGSRAGGGALWPLLKETCCG